MTRRRRTARQPLGIPYAVTWIEQTATDCIRVIHQLCNIMLLMRQTECSHWRLDGQSETPCDAPPPDDPASFHPHRSPGLDDTHVALRLDFTAGEFCHPCLLESAIQGQLAATQLREREMPPREHPATSACDILLRAGTNGPASVLFCLVSNMTRRFSMDFKLVTLRRPTAVFCTASIQLSRPGNPNSDSACSQV